MHPLTAIAREKQLKRWNRAKKIAFIEQTNPFWSDLTGNGATQSVETTEGRALDYASLRSR